MQWHVQVQLYAFGLANCRAYARVSRGGTGKRVSWLLRKQTKERNEGTGALGGPAPLFMGHCICWPRITLQRRPVWSHLTSDFTFDSLLANGSCISIRWPALSRYYEPYSIRCYAFSTAIIDPRSFPLFDSFANWRRAGWDDLGGDWETFRLFIQGRLELFLLTRLSDLSFLYPRSISFDSNRFYLNKLKLYRYESVISFDLIVFCRRFQVEVWNFSLNWYVLITYWEVKMN